MGNTLILVQILHKMEEELLQSDSISQKSLIQHAMNAVREEIHNRKTEEGRRLARRSWGALI